MRSANSTLINHSLATLTLLPSFFHSSLSRHLLTSQYLSQRSAQAIDVELMSPTGGGFTFEQLVELGKHLLARSLSLSTQVGPRHSYSLSSSPRGNALQIAGFSVAQAITKEFHHDQYPRVAIFSGPGNNGLDGECVGLPLEWTG